MIYNFLSLILQRNFNVLHLLLLNQKAKILSIKQMTKDSEIALIIQWIVFIWINVTYCPCFNAAYELPAEFLI